jgi:hypothetical protein
MVFKRSETLRNDHVTVKNGHGSFFKTVIMFTIWSRSRFKIERITVLNDINKFSKTCELKNEL